MVLVNLSPNLAFLSEGIKLNLLGPEKGGKLNSLGPVNRGKTQREREIFNISGSYLGC